MLFSVNPTLKVLGWGDWSFAWGYSPGFGSKPTLIQPKRLRIALELLWRCGGFFLGDTPLGEA
ncbi:MAG: hypothetical protein ACO4AI_04760, partial [Prochlorothrix sp.]